MLPFYSPSFFSQARLSAAFGSGLSGITAGALHKLRMPPASSPACKIPHTKVRSGQLLS
ncbi:hypothetical protein HMPREF1548_04364 [Clostridium sp. KLE 1755]|nr:hypothetical protein HMPREF1548_04364 [Clostridium sp. KLE 1755]